ncbi:MAG: hypothetical protein ACK4WD_05065 [Flavobacteriales bacterium]|jgi:hypothetical protein
MQIKLRLNLFAQLGVLGVLAVKKVSELVVNSTLVIVMTLKILCASIKRKAAKGEKFRKEVCLILTS